jgi:hypothetical protein
MRHSRHRSHGASHLKMLLVGLLFATLVAGVGIAARLDHNGVETAPKGKFTGWVVKAAQPMSASGQPPVLW